MSLGFLTYAFTAGAFATLNPCGFALLPAVLGRFLARHGSGHGLGVGALLALGTLTAFGGIGLLVSLLGTALAAWLPYVNLALAAGLLALGGLTLAGRGVGLDLVQVRVPAGQRTSEFYWFGVAYGLASLGCTLPVFLAVTGVAFASGPGAGLAALLAYGLGMGAVLVGVTLAAALGKDTLLKRIRRAGAYLEPLGGLLLTGAGAYLLGYNLSFLTLNPALGRGVGVAAAVLALALGAALRRQPLRYNEE